MVRVLGIDPGLRTTGWGVVDCHRNTLSYVASGTIVSNNRADFSVRLRQLHDGLADVIERYKVNEASIEETFVNRNALSSLKLGHARGVLILASSLAGVSLSEYAARLVKKSVVGVGGADKQQVITMMHYLLPGCGVSQPDEADALAVAICHINHRSSVVGDQQILSTIES